MLKFRGLHKPSIVSQMLKPVGEKKNALNSER